MIKRLIASLSKSSKDVRECQEQYHKIFKDQEENLTPYENVWHIFDTAVSSIHHFTDKNDNIIEKLQSIQESIPNEKNNQLLEDKIQQIRSTSIKLEKEITDLENQRDKLQTKIHQQQTGSYRYALRKKFFPTDQKKSKEKLEDVSRSIKTKKKLYKTAEKIFHQQAADIVEQNTENEVRLSELMKQQFNDFVKSFDIYPKKFKKAFEHCNPEKDIDEWKQNILYINAKPSFESSDEEEDHDEKRSTESENSDEEIPRQYFKSVKSRSIESENIDEKIFQPLKSAKSRTTPNENNNNKKTIRQQSLRSLSVVDKNRDKKIKTSRQSPEFQPVNSHDTDDEN